MTDLSKLSREQLVALVANLQREQAAKVSFKVSEKGAISIYGLGRWPITLYKSQFDALFTDDNIRRAREFRKANDALLASKD
jgi:hypothetical protein